MLKLSYIVNLFSIVALKFLHVVRLFIFGVGTLLKTEVDAKILKIIGEVEDIKQNLKQNQRY